MGLSRDSWKAAPDGADFFAWLRPASLRPLYQNPLAQVTASLFIYHSSNGLVLLPGKGTSEANDLL